MSDFLVFILLSTGQAWKFSNKLMLNQPPEIKYLSFSPWTILPSTRKEFLKSPSALPVSRNCNPKGIEVPITRRRNNVDYNTDPWCTSYAACKSASYSKTYQLNANLKNLQPILITSTTTSTRDRVSLGHTCLTYIGR